MERVILFTNPERFEAGVLDRGITLKPYEEIFSYLGEHFTPSSTLYISPDRSNLRLIGALPASLKRVEGLDISTLLKSRKNKTEQEGMRLAHKADGVAMVKFLAQVASGEKCYTELTLATELENYRRQSSDYLGPSFSTIAGFKEHGALAHYSASEESSVELVGNGLLVLDSGGQYTCGTTDITRTLLFGEASSEMMRDYTLVLKGNLALSRQQFPSQTAGYQLDSLARQFLWQAGLNYGHGTGHGVGFCLNVHEGPQNISPRPIEVALEEGMVISNEPGIYREGSHGVRVENLVMVQRGDVSEMGQFYRFEVLTLAPFERRLIDTTLLSEEEQREINDYHARVYEELQGELSEAQRAWLRQATLPL
jgi:Xaa-Pro aminopeptidase